MIAIYCSKKLELFIKDQISEFNSEIENYFGNWIGRLVIINRRKVLLITNEKTAFSVVISDIKKNDLKDINSIISNAIINQVKHDVGLSEKQEIGLFNELQQIIFCPTNNNKKLVGSMNEFVFILNYELTMRYGDNSKNALELSSILNSYLVGAKIELNHDKYFFPKELMAKLLQNYEEIYNDIKQ